MNRPKLKLFSPASLGGRQANARALLLAGLAFFCLLQFLRTFMRWPDPIVDFGRELYVPWQLAEGRALIRDVPYFQGPLSPWLNELWFRLFGVGVVTLAKVNLVIFLGIVFLLFDLIEKIADRFAAFWACFLVIAVFGFGQYMTTANYNFITPYAHEITHGMFLCLLALSAADRFSRSAGAIPGGWLGFVLGALFLTKPEMFAAGAAGAAALVGYALYAGGIPGGWRRVKSGLISAGAAFVLVPAAAFLALLRANSAPAAWRGTLGGFTQLLEPRVTANPFQAWVAGFDDVPGNLWSILAMTALWAMVLLGGKLLDRWQAGQESGAAPAKLMAPIVVFGLLSALFPFIPFYRLPQAFPVLGLALLFFLLPGRRAGLATSIPEAARPLAFGFTVFSLVILARMLLKVRFFHYGFAFALPISVLLVAAVGCWIPKLQRLHGGGRLARMFTVYAVLAFSFVFYREDLPWAFGRVFPASPRTEDAFLVDGQSARIFGVVGEALGQFVRPTDSLVVIPEGAMINYLHRLHAPVGYTSLLPIVFDIFGEQAIVGRFRATPPDFILYYFMSGAEWGKPDFGKDYGIELGAFIRENYQPVWRAGAPPFDGSGRFGLELLRRKGKP